MADGGKCDYRLLFGLSANTSQHEYRNRSHFLSLLSHELDVFDRDTERRSEYIIFTGVDQETFRADFVDPVNSLLRHTHTYTGWF